MTPERRRISIAGVVICLAMLSGAAVAMAGTPNAVIGTAKLQGSGPTGLVNARGHAVYVYSGDAQGRSNCYGQCLTGYANWRPLLTRSKVFARQGSRVNPKLLGTTRRRSGKLQVTYNHHPLYTYGADTGPAQWFGQRCQGYPSGHWLVITPDGKPDRQDINVCQAY